MPIVGDGLRHRELVDLDPSAKLPVANGDCGIFQVRLPQKG